MGFLWFPFKPTLRKVPPKQPDLFLVANKLGAAREAEGNQLRRDAPNMGDDRLRDQL